MGVTITAVPATGAESLTPPANTERDLQDFAASLRNSPMAGLPQAANPATLVGEVFGGLRGYFEKAQTVQRRVMSPDATSHGGAGVAVASLEQPLGLARSDSWRDADDAADGDGSDPWKVGLAELERVQELVLQTQLFLAETAVVTNTTASISPIINDLLKGQ